MKKVTIFLFLIINVALITSCKNNSSNSNTNRSNYINSYESDYDEDGYDEDGYDEDGYDEYGYDEYGYDEDGYDDDGYDEDGKDDNGYIRDDTYSATVDYYNPVTGYSATYTLDVEVESGEVTVIYFPNDGYLDNDHIYPSELDDDGYVEIEGEEGKTYEVQINY